MPVNRNALIRYTTIDKCLRNHYRKWTLEDLMDACSDALYEFEGIDKGVSRRTVQLDIQNMRSEKLGYNAPIVVTERKYYTYEDSDYSITQLPLSDQDLNKLNDAVEILKQFQGFSHFSEMTGLIQKLENKIHTEQSKERPIIHIDKNENLKGLEHLNVLYQTIQNKKVLKIEYQSFKARNSHPIYFFPYLLKEFNNRWFLVGRQKSKKNKLMTLALDRFQNIDIMEKMQFLEDPDFDPDEYYKHAIGVTVNEGLSPRTIVLKIDRTNAPYVITKPIHASQQVIEKGHEGIIIRIKVVPNYELERVLLGFGPGLEVLSPPSLRKRIGDLIIRSEQIYRKV
ncbi:helix-turn-helix transcriptional regulator [Marinifilum caeruleilacunae]|uniref:WYL domain-containing protein n=1 Tax=Marinifilum caeruleilacunae TaxID=2499076 RepID=A0ABX1WUF0_9BACT|nr:WYL domain-containing protein [Marinifilum caeruleilacunae]NOU59702.1 WYL domain-containing protein [Marinifilum caeruleilacunae]